MKKNPEVQISLSGDAYINGKVFDIQKNQGSDPLSCFLSEHRNLLETVAVQLYDCAWPDWRNHHVLKISLYMIGEELMAQINSEYRQVDAPTDVLTFPLFEENGKFNPPSGMIPLPLGDILLCPGVIRTNAKEHGVAEESEAALVVFHGMLHLLAWDHDTQASQGKMWRVQEGFRDLFLRLLRDEVQPLEEKL